LTTEVSRIAVLLPSLDGGGAERSMLTLVRAFLDRGRAVDLLLCKPKGPLMDEVPGGAHVIPLAPGNGLTARARLAALNPGDLGVLLRPVLLAKKNAPEIARIGALAQYLRSRRPGALLSALTYANLTAIWARQLSGVSVPLLVSERNAIATYCAAPHKARKWRFRYLPDLVARTYPRADAVVAVSQNVQRELSDRVGLRHPRLTTIYNPVVDDTLIQAAAEPLSHPWFVAGAPPVILGVGRFTEQKDFPTLLRAFAELRTTRPARLVLLGDGKLRGELGELAEQLGIGEDLWMPGFVHNPFPYMTGAAALALSSRYEGLPGVLIQAMACGCPVLSTDCPGGSAEILAGGEYGPLVAGGDSRALASALADVLDQPVAADLLKRRAGDFSVDRATDAYLALIDAVAGAPPAPPGKSRDPR
jgi:glycosyltransferase involved in cell wall biosynthesis